MDRLRTLIVDDERPARAKVARLLDGMDRVEVVGEAANGDDAVKRIQTLRPDLLILDIQMPGKTGFEVLSSLSEQEIPYIIFATAYDTHAIQAFEVAAVDYLLKPFDKQRLAIAVDRVVERASEKQDRTKYVEELMGLLRGVTDHVERVVVDFRGRRLVVEVDNIRSLQAEGNYVSIHVEGRSHLCRGSLASYENRLDPGRFVRVHRSALVNVRRIREIKSIARGDQYLVMDDGSEVRMSRRYRERLSRFLAP